MASDSDLPTGLETFCQVVNEDLQMLARLHDRELDDPTLTALVEVSFPDCMGLLLEGEMALEGRQLLKHALKAQDEPAGPHHLDLLAADYADIYLTHGIQASPYESVWLDEEGLTMQAPMFQVRRWYERYGLVVPDWRMHADDHLVYQLKFVAHLFERCNEQQMREAAHFMDEHILRWLDSFAKRVAARCASPFYAGLSMLTAAYMQQLRSLLVAMLDEPIPTAEEIEQRIGACGGDEEVVSRYMPGMAPSW